MAEAIRSEAASTCSECMGSRFVFDDDGEEVVCAACSINCSACDEAKPKADSASVGRSHYCGACIDREKRDLSEVAGLEVTDADAVDALHYRATSYRPATMALPYSPEVL